MPHADVNGQRLFYEDRGEGDDVIVFSHGLFMDHSMFDAQVAALPEGWRAVAWDERGHGATETTDEPFTYWDSAADLLGLLDHLGVGRAVLAGMSQGGYLSLRAALTAPERVRALVLIDTQTGVEDPEKLAGYDQLLDAWTQTPGGPPQEVLDTVATIILGPGYAGTPAWQERWRAMPAAKVRQVYATLTSREDDVAPRLAELTMPALVVHGSEDLAIEVALARRLAEDLADADLHVVEGAGHAPNLTHAAEVNEALLPFLERV